MSKTGSSLPIQFKRLYDGPLDVDSTFETLELAQKYVEKGTSYKGQLITIRNGNSYDIYTISVNNKLEKYSCLGCEGSTIPNTITWYEI